MSLPRTLDETTPLLPGQYNERGCGRNLASSLYSARKAAMSFPLFVPVCGLPAVSQGGRRRAFFFGGVGGLSRKSEVGTAKPMCCACGGGILRPCIGNHPLDSCAWTASPPAPTGSWSESNVEY
jgi:hypothetical protein